MSTHDDIRNHLHDWQIKNSNEIACAVTGAMEAALEANRAAALDHEDLVRSLMMSYCRELAERLAPVLWAVEERSGAAALGQEVQA